MDRSIRIVLITNLGWENLLRSLLLRWNARSAGQPVCIAQGLIV